MKNLEHKFKKNNLKKLDEKLTLSFATFFCELISLGIDFRVFTEVVKVDFKLKWPTLIKRTHKGQ